MVLLNTQKLKSIIIANIVSTMVCLPPRFRAEILRVIQVKNVFSLVLCGFGRSKVRYSD